MHHIVLEGAERANSPAASGLFEERYLVSNVLLPLLDGDASFLVDRNVLRFEMHLDFVEVGQEIVDAETGFAANATPVERYEIVVRRCIRGERRIFARRYGVLPQEFARHSEDVVEFSDRPRCDDGF